MARDVLWTYELPAIGADASGLEEFVLETRDGERVGTVASVVRHGDGVYVVFGHAHGPASFRALSWEHVTAVDADAAVVDLRLTAAELDEHLLALDPRNRVEDDTADAVRVEAPGGLPAYAETGEAAGPRDRPLVFAAIGAFALGLLCFLALVAFAPEASIVTVAVLAVAAGALVGLALLLTVRLYRRPYERR